MRSPQSDIDREVGSYQSSMTPLAKSLSRLATRALESLAKDVRDMMVRGMYDPRNATVFLNSIADASTVVRLENLMILAPERYRKGLQKAVMRAIGRGMTYRVAINQLARLNCFSVVGMVHDTAMRILSHVAEDGYYRGTFALQKETGMGWAVDKMAKGRVAIVVEQAFSMEDARKFMSPLIDMSDKAIVSGMLQGLTPDQVLNGVKRVETANMFRSKRTARTTITETASDSHMESYKEHGVKMYQFSASWDERTCPICGALDGKRFPLDEAEVGVNYPPMHPNCRCTTVAALSPEIEALMRQRKYTDRSDGETYEIPRNFSYEDWYKRFGPGRTDGKAYIPAFKPKN